MSRSVRYHQVVVLFSPPTVHKMSVEIKEVCVRGSACGQNHGASTSGLAGALAAITVSRSRRPERWLHPDSTATSASFVTQRRPSSLLLHLPTDSLRQLNCHEFEKWAPPVTFFLWPWWWIGCSRQVVAACCSSLKNEHLDLQLQILTVPHLDHFYSTFFFTFRLFPYSNKNQTLVPQGFAFDPLYVFPVVFPFLSNFSCCNY